MGAFFRNGRYEITECLSHGSFTITYKDAIVIRKNGTTSNIQVAIKEFLFCMIDIEIVNALPLGTELEDGKYKVEQVLGQGTFGITYMASLHLEKPLDSRGTIINVAVKEFFMGMNERDGTRVIGCYNDTFRHYKKKFVDEANKLRLFDNSKIVKVIDAFEANNTAYYVMEYIEGGSLNNYITKYGKLNVDEAVRLIKQIGEAVQFMHDRRMLHLDLKPSNIVLHNNGDVVLIDFGLSKLFDEKGKPETSSTIGLGTKGYAPLEQANYKADSTNELPVTMDIYALGAILFKMLTGSTPPDASFILNNGFPTEELEVEGVDVALIECIAKAMSPKVTDRFQSVSSFTNSIKYERKQTTSQKLIGGSVDESTTLEVEPSYIANSITPYYEGLARVQGVNGKFGFVSQEKEVVVPLEWRQASYFTNGLAEVMNDKGRWGYIDKKGKVVIPCQWAMTSAFKEGVARVRNSEGESLYIDKEGNRITLKSQKLIGGSVDESTTLEVEPSYIASSITPYYEGLARVLGENGKFGFVNMDKKVVIPLEWRQATFFTNGLAEVMNDNGKWGYIDKKGKVVIPCQWAMTSAFKEGVARVRNSEGESLYLYIDKEGNWITFKKENYIGHDIINTDSSEAKEMGCIVVTSFPSGAHVRVDNVYKGRTPITMKVSTGMHDVNVQSEKYKFTKWSYQGVDYSIDINYKGQTKDLYVDFGQVKKRYDLEAQEKKTSLDPVREKMKKVSLEHKSKNTFLSLYFDPNSPIVSYLLSSTLFTTTSCSLLFLLRKLLMGEAGVSDLPFYFLSLCCVPSNILLLMSFFGVILFVRGLIKEKYKDETIWDRPMVIFKSTPLICGIITPLLIWISERSVFTYISLFLSLFIMIVVVISVNFIALNSSVMKSGSLLGCTTLTLIACCTYLDPIHNVSSYIEKSLLFFTPIYLICLIIGLIWGKANGINFKYKNVWTYILTSILILITGWVMPA